jgi:hypothetical protein
VKDRAGLSFMERVEFPSGMTIRLNGDELPTVDNPELWKRITAGKAYFTERRVMRLKIENMKILPKIYFLK